jgi:hypothetical protein
MRVVAGSFTTACPIDVGGPSRRVRIPGRVSRRGQEFVSHVNLYDRPDRAGWICVRVCAT